MKQLKKVPRQKLENFSTIFMQLGLVLVLFIVFISLEYETEQKAVVVNKPVNEIAEVYVFNRPVAFVKEVIEKPKVKKRAPITTIIDKPEIIENDTPDEAVLKAVIEPETIEVKEGTVIEEDVPEEEDIEEDVAFIRIEDVPVYPGCDKGSKKDKRKCFSKKLSKLIQKKFNGDLVNELGYDSGKRVKIYVQFKISKTGDITNIDARAPHPRLKKEAIRMAKQIPKMKPGRQRNRPVGVNYTLPITLKAQ